MFRPDEARATSISHSGSVRSEQRSLGEKDLPPSGLRRIWPVASLLVDYSPMAGRRPPRASPQAKLGETNDIVFMPQTTQCGAVATCPERGPPARRPFLNIART